MRGGTRAAATLERLLPYATERYEIQELLGLVYASLAEGAKAEHQLKDGSSIEAQVCCARTNFGTILLHPVRRLWQANNSASSRSWSRRVSTQIVILPSSVSVRKNCRSAAPFSNWPSDSSPTHMKMAMT